MQDEKSLLIHHGGVMEEWKYDPLPPAADTKEALGFLTDVEREQLMLTLDKHKHQSHHSREATLLTFTKAINECGWKNRCSEIVQRLRPLVKHGKIEYGSLAERS